MKLAFFNSLFLFHTWTRIKWPILVPCEINTSSFSCTIVTVLEQHPVVLRSIIVYQGLWSCGSQQEVIPSKSRTFPPPSVTRAVGLFSVFSRDGNFMNKMLGGFVHLILVHSENQCLVCHCVGFGDSHLLPIEWLLV